MNTQYSSSSMRKLTQAPRMPSRLVASWVSGPSCRLTLRLHQPQERPVAERRDALAGMADVDLYAFLLRQLLRAGRGAWRDRAVISAARVRLTTLTICCATWRARGSRSVTRKISQPGEVRDRRAAARSAARCATAGCAGKTSWRRDRVMSDRVIEARPRCATGSLSLITYSLTSPRQRFSRQE